MNRIAVFDVEKKHSTQLSVHKTNSVSVNICCYGWCYSVFDFLICSFCLQHEKWEKDKKRGRKIEYVERCTYLTMLFFIYCIWILFPFALCLISLFLSMLSAVRFYDVEVIIWLGSFFSAVILWHPRKSFRFIGLINISWAQNWITAIKIKEFAKKLISIYMLYIFLFLLSKFLKEKKFEQNLS